MVVALRGHGHAVGPVAGGVPGEVGVADEASGPDASGPLVPVPGSLVLGASRGTRGVAVVPGAAVVAVVPGVAVDVAGDVVAPAVRLSGAGHVPPDPPREPVPREASRTATRTARTSAARFTATSVAWPRTPRAAVVLVVIARARVRPGRS